MKRDETVSCIGMLVLWHRHSQHGALTALGYPQECPSTRGYQASRQYDDINGAQDSEERAWLVQKVGAALDQIAEPHLTALHVLARNASTGVSVWRSPRLPADPEECETLASEALAIFSELV